MASEIDMSFLLVIDVQMALGIWFTSNGANCKPVIFSWRTMSRKGDLTGIVDSEHCASRAQIINPNRVLQLGETRGSGFCSQLRNKNFKPRVTGSARQGMRHDDQPGRRRLAHGKSRPSRRVQLILRLPGLYVVHQRLIVHE
jgi:hypothetical protein